MTNQSRSMRHGFTLVETIATIVILATVMTVCSKLISQATASYTASATRAELHAELSSAMERIAIELRSCAIDPGGSFGPDMTAVRPNSISWSTASGTRVLWLSGSSLTLTVGGTDCVLVSNATALTIQAYTQSNAALATTLDGAACLPVQRVQFTITAQRLGITETLRTLVFLRCAAAGSSLP